uniref:Uncharacterized protein n=1 Tax=Jahnella sp. MSr9139 TaxID=1434086 RepID=A0A3S7UW59_9BACT|nr:hypothetical protein [Jahnella sp. MSr9139]
MTMVDARRAPARPARSRGWLGAALCALAFGAALAGVACKGAEAPQAGPPGGAVPDPNVPVATGAPPADTAQPTPGADTTQPTPGADTPPPPPGGCGAAAVPGKRYVGRSPDDCARIRYVCEPGESQFTDDCGCGCEKPAPGAKP